MAANDTEFTADGFRTKQCVTKEDAANLGRLIEKQGDSCTSKVSPVLNGQMKIAVKCTRPASDTTAVVKFQGEKAYTMETTSTMSDGAGKPVTYKTSGWGKWLGSDCGKVKPAAG